MSDSHIQLMCDSFFPALFILPFCLTGSGNFQSQSLSPASWRAFVFTDNVHGIQIKMFCQFGLHHHLAFTIYVYLEVRVYRSLIILLSCYLTVSQDSLSYVKTRSQSMALKTLSNFSSLALTPKFKGAISYGCPTGISDLVCCLFFRFSMF